MPRLTSSSSATCRAPTATSSTRFSTICVVAYREQLDEDGQVDFKGKAKAFLRSYGFLASILPYTNADWEKHLDLSDLPGVPKLPAPVEEDLSKGILEAIDMDSYRVEKQAAQKVQLADEDAEIEPAPTDGGGQKPELRAGPALEHHQGLQRPVRQHRVEGPRQDRDGSSQWSCPSRWPPTRRIRTPSPTPTSRMRGSSTTRPCGRAMTELIADHTELFKQFSDNESFRKWLLEMNFAATYNKVA